MLEPFPLPAAVFHVAARALATQALSDDAALARAIADAQWEPLYEPLT